MWDLASVKLDCSYGYIWLVLLTRLNSIKLSKRSTVVIFILDIEIVFTSEDIHILNNKIYDFKKSLYHVPDGCSGSAHPVMILSHIYLYLSLTFKYLLKYLSSEHIWKEWFSKGTLSSSNVKSKSAVFHFRALCCTRCAITRTKTTTKQNKNGIFLYNHTLPPFFFSWFWKNKYASWIVFCGKRLSLCAALMTHFWAENFKK